MNLKNKKYNFDGSIDCEIEHKLFGWIQTTLSNNDSATKELFLKVQSSGTVAPYVEVLPTQDEINNKRIAEIKARLLEIDSESIRPLRAITAGTANEFDTNKINALEAERASLASELVALNG